MKRSNSLVRAMVGLAMAAVVVAAGTWSANARAQEVEERLNHTYIDFKYGSSTHKSLTLESNDTAYTMAYGFGVWAGSDRSMGMSWNREATTTTFELATATLAETWEDMVFRYRYGSFYSGIIMSNLLMTGSTGSTDLFDARGSGYGVNVGLLIPVSKTALMHVDVKSVNIASAMEQTEQAFTVTARTDVDIGTTIDITKRLIDFIFGYRQRTYTIAAGSTSGLETHTMTYVGFALGFEF